mgnify:FL=1
MDRWSDTIFVLDQSGSMVSMWDESIEGFNKFLASQRSSPVFTRLTLVQFNNMVSPVYASIPAQEALELNRETYYPGGSTALYDALGLTIDMTNLRLKALPQSERPETVIFGILTDGQENASREFTHKQVMDKIDHYTQDEGWEFVFLAMGPDAFRGSQDLGFQQAPNHPVFSVRMDAADMAFKKLDEEVLARKLKGRKP